MRLIWPTKKRRKHVALAFSLPLSLSLEGEESEARLESDKGGSRCTTVHPYSYFYSHRTPPRPSRGFKL